MKPVQARVPIFFFGALALVACAGATEAPIGTGGTGGTGSTGSTGSTGGTGGTDGTGGTGGVDECALGADNCDGKATCADLPDGFACTCIAGYEGDGLTCSDADECAAGTNNCDPAAICANTAGAFTCTCPPGYTDPSGDGTTCADVDECTAKTDDCDPVATCANIPGAFTCTCPPGYADTNGDGTTCVDVDECTAMTDTCDPFATCANTEGAFTCTCPKWTSDINGDGTKCSPMGETCAMPIIVNPTSLPAIFTGDTTPGSLDYSFGAGTCVGASDGGGAASNDIAYSLTPAVSGTFTLKLTGTGFDSSLYVVTDCADIGGTCLGAVDAACSDCTESLVVTLVAGTPYFILVDGGGAGAAAGPYSLQIIPEKSLANPAQIDVSSVLTDDTIVNNGMGGIDPTQEPMDGSSYNLLTQSTATQVGGASAIGLPDSASFAANAAHPTVQLHWSNTDNGPNSRILLAGSSFTVPIPSDFYAQLQVYGLSTEGPSVMLFTLTYSDATTDVRTITFGDWFNDPAPAGQFFLIDNLDRIGGGVFSASHDPAIAGANLNPNAAKTLVSVTATHQPSAGRFVFYGATGW